MRLPSHMAAFYHCLCGRRWWQTLNSQTSTSAWQCLTPAKVAWDASTTLVGTSACPRMPRSSSAMERMNLRMTCETCRRLLWRLQPYQFGGSYRLVVQAEGALDTVLEPALLSLHQCNVQWASWLMRPITAEVRLCCELYNVGLYIECVSVDVVR